LDQREQLRTLFFEAFAEDSGSWGKLAEVLKKLAEVLARVSGSYRNVLAEVVAKVSGS
jgi:hypothetical protein